jgi:hypothetical protein
MHFGIDNRTMCADFEFRDHCMRNKRNLMLLIIFELSSMSVCDWELP